MILLRLKLNSKTNYITLCNDYDMLQEAINEVSKITSKRKEDYHYHLASLIYTIYTVLVLVLKHIGPY